MRTIFPIKACDRVVMNASQPLKCVSISEEIVSI